MSKGFTIIEAIFLLLLPIAIGGWIGNIVRLTGVETVLEPMAILRIIGIFVAPLGVVLGFIPN